MMPNIKDSSVKRPEFVNLGNWREFPNSKWSFQHVRELMPTSVIKCAENIAKPLNKNLQDVMGMVCDSPEGRCSFAQLLRQGDSDGRSAYEDDLGSGLAQEELVPDPVGEVRD